MNTKEIILKKTFNLLLLKGFDNVSITDIKNYTGMSRGILYHYFKNKEELFIEVTERYFVHIFDFDIRKIKDFTVYEFCDFLNKRFKKIAKTISTIEQEINGSSDASLLNYHFLFYQVMQRDAIFRNKYKTTTEKELIGWEYALQNSIDKNEIRQDIDIKSSARQLFTLTDGIWFQSIFSNDGRIIINNIKESLLHYIRLLE
ncbi:TetR/AcrR family transcriptional regulator [Dysgonomonas sp. Marseille-P4361]|uniref:TetR/AcrR family transcriptional regulator n=1 Tax=Dysgonomonas sp. Marseille-P4361 TaxID=2161820 RepID=UPI000D556CCD|nr:TetR/AcrR family transcriptional regulator [Dysgonomonas sp. Marseille-P4361]